MKKQVTANATERRVRGEQVLAVRFAEREIFDKKVQECNGWGRGWKC